MPDLSNLFNFIDEKNTQYISDQTGISTGNICDWKSERSKPSAESLVIVAEALNCSVDYLLGRTNNERVCQNTNCCYQSTCLITRCCCWFWETGNR